LSKDDHIVISFGGVKHELKQDVGKNGYMVCKIDYTDKIVNNLFDIEIQENADGVTTKKIKAKIRFTK
jgi:hypothetical protein